MESRTKLLGHSVHRILVVFPIGLLATAFAMDVAYLATEAPSLAMASHWNIAFGVVAGLVAAVFGLLDWLAIPAGTRAKAVGLWHAGGNVVMLSLFVVSWFQRWETPGHEPRAVSMALEVLAIGLASLTGWLGGELVTRHGVGIDDDAGLDAPSSLARGGHGGTGAMRTPPRLEIEPRP